MCSPSLTPPHLSQPSPQPKDPAIRQQQEFIAQRERQRERQRQQQRQQQQQRREHEHVAEQKEEEHQQRQQKPPRPPAAARLLPAREGSMMGARFIGGSVPPPLIEVSVTDRAFKPSIARVAPGQRVRFRVSGPAPHKRTVRARLLDVDMFR